MKKNQQSWVVKCQYKNKEVFWFGTIWMDEGAAEHEVLTAAEKALDEVFPTRPRVENLIKGYMTLYTE